MKTENNKSTIKRNIVINNFSAFEIPIIIIKEYAYKKELIITNGVITEKLILLRTKKVTIDLTNKKSLYKQQERSYETRNIQ